MIFGPMTESQMIEYLQSMDKLKEQLAKRKKHLYQEVETLEECIERNTFHHEHEERTQAAPAYKGDKLYRIWMNTLRDISQEFSDLAMQYEQIAQEEEKRAHIIRCINMLPLLQRELIEELYIKRTSWKEYIERNYISIATLGRRRKRAFKKLMELYNIKFSPENETKKRGNHAV